MADVTTRRLGELQHGVFRVLLDQPDEASLVPMRPDITWWVDGRCRAVIDAKYMSFQLQSFPNADLYQMLAYCTVLGLQRGHLVYAAGDTEPRTNVVREVGIEIVVHALDLDLPPAELRNGLWMLSAIIAGAPRIP